VKFSFKINLLGVFEFFIVGDCGPQEITGNAAPRGIFKFPTKSQ
jgi:hypothetical protein